MLYQFCFLQLPTEVTLTFIMIHYFLNTLCLWWLTITILETPKCFHISRTPIIIGKIVVYIVIEWNFLKGKRWNELVLSSKQSSLLVKLVLRKFRIRNMKNIVNAFFKNSEAISFLLSTLWQESHIVTRIPAKGRSSYHPLAYFSYIFISGKNVVISQQKWQHFCQKWKYWKNM